jgi:hypothetical protein
MDKVIIKLKGENTYWKKQTCGTTKDINEAHHFPLAEASEITHSARSVEAIEIPNEGMVTIRTRDRYWTSYFGTFTEDKDFASLFNRAYAETITRNYDEDTVIEDADIHLKRPLEGQGIFSDESDAFTSLDLSDWDINKTTDFAAAFRDITKSKPKCECIEMADSCDCEAYTLQGTEVGAQGKFEGILTSLNSLLEYKNKRYGNVALEPLDIFAKYGGIGQRLDDKLSRIKNAEELRKNDVADMLGYLVLLCKEHEFENFDEFKD